MIVCCADRFGVYSVLALEMGYGITKPNSPLFLCLAIDIIMLVLIYVGKVLDTKKIWLKQPADK